MTHVLPREIDGYRLTDVIGEGGMGVVYRGVSIALDRPVAVKMVKPRGDDDGVLAERFLREARLAARIQSAHVVDVMHFGKTAEGELYLVMELLRGKTLERVVAKEGSLAPARAVHIAVQVCRALQAAHDLEVVHRDLKFSNVMLVEQDGVPDFVKVLDFGIAKLMREGATRLTKSGMILGTFQSIAPEQVTGGVIDGRTDVYALGALLYRMLAGAHVFAGDDAAAFAYHHVHSRPTSLLERAPERNVPRALDDVVMQCLEKDPARRFSSMRAVIGALLGGEATQAELATTSAGHSMALYRAVFPDGPTQAEPGSQSTLFADEPRSAKLRAAIASAAVDETTPSGTWRAAFAGPPTAETGEVLGAALARVAEAPAASSPDEGKGAAGFPLVLALVLASVAMLLVVVGGAAYLALRAGAERARADVASEAVVVEPVQVEQAAPPVVAADQAPAQAEAVVEEREATVPTEAKRVKATPRKPGAPPPSTTAEPAPKPRFKRVLTGAPDGS